MTKSQLILEFALCLGFGFWVLGFEAGSAQAPLPVPGAFYDRIRENMARAEEANHLYSYRERRTDIHTNPFGRLGTGGTSVFEVYPSPVRSLTYRRLVARDGVPVAARELAEQDRAYRERAAGAKGRTEEESERARQRRRRAIEDVINALDFRIDRRETHDGMSAIVMVFKPRMAATPATRQGRIAQKFAGTVWVDEAAAEVMELQAKSVDDISLGYGIVARLGEGTTATLTRRPIGDGLWMPTRLTLSGRGRAAFFIRRFDLDHVIEWFDYRRLPVASLTPFLDPRVHGQPGARPQ